MIYNDSDFTKRGVEASILSIKNDLNRRIGYAQLKYGEIYDAIVAESNGLVDFLNEFRAAVDTIVNECNDLQGLTDEELTEIKQRIEELKEILDSVEIPDLPKIKAPEEIFSEDGAACATAEFGCDIFGSCESGFCAIGVGAQVSVSSPLPGKDNGNNATTFGCYEYTVIYGEEGLCHKNYVVWGNCNTGDGVCIMNYDEELDNQCGRDYTGQYDGCLSKYEDENYKCDGDFMIHMCVNHDNGDSCSLGFMSSTITCDYMYGESTGSFGQCESNYAICEANVGDAPTKTCEESYFTTKVGITTCIGYATQDENCPQSYQFTVGMIECVADYKDDNTECKTNFEKAGDSQSISACTGGFKDDTYNCPTNWSYGLGKNACNLDYSDGKITCAKGYITDGVRKWCDNHDAACGKCQLGYCAPANYTPCDYCPSYSPPCSYTPECSEGEPEPCHQEPTCQPCVDIADTCGGSHSCSDSCFPNCVFMHDECTGVCNVIRHGSND